MQAYNNNAETFRVRELEKTVGNLVSSVNADGRVTKMISGNFVEVVEGVQEILPDAYVNLSPFFRVCGNLYKLIVVVLPADAERIKRKRDEYEVPQDK